MRLRYLSGLESSSGSGLHTRVNRSCADKQAGLIEAVPTSKPEELEAAPVTERWLGKRGAEGEQTDPRTSSVGDRASRGEEKTMSPRRAGEGC